jgi:hypothetical protein
MSQPPEETRSQLTNTTNERSNMVLRRRRLQLREQYNNRPQQRVRDSQLVHLLDMINQVRRQANVRSLSHVQLRPLVLVCAFFAVVTFMMLLLSPYRMVCNQIKAGVDMLIKYIQQDPVVKRFYQKNIQDQALMDVAWMIFRMHMVVLERFMVRVLDRLGVNLGKNFDLNKFKSKFQYELLLPCAAILFHFYSRFRGSRSFACVRRGNGGSTLPSNNNQAINWSPNGLPGQNNNQAINGNKTNYNQAINWSPNGLPNATATAIGKVKTSTGVSRPNAKPNGSSTGSEQSNQLAGVPEFNLKDAHSYEEVMMLAVLSLETRMKTKELESQENQHIHEAITVLLQVEHKGAQLIELFLLLLNKIATRIQRKLGTLDRVRSRPNVLVNDWFNQINWSVAEGGSLVEQHLQDRKLVSNLRRDNELVTEMISELTAVGVNARRKNNTASAFRIEAPGVNARRMNNTASASPM